MDNLRATLRALFQDVRPEEVLRRVFDVLGSRGSEASAIDRERLVAYLLDCGGAARNAEECHAVADIAQTRWGHLGEHPSSESAESVFHVVVELANKVLVIPEQEVQVKFKHLLRWREVVLHLGEDMFVAAFLAQHDRTLAGSVQRRYFAWKPVIRTNDAMLESVLQRGVADVHFHLKGSSYQLDLSWLSLMNDLKDRASKFKELKPALHSRKIHSNHAEQHYSLHGLVIKAAIIRLLMFRMLIIKDDAASSNPDDNHSIDRLHKLLQIDDEAELRMHADEIQREIDFYRDVFGRKYGGQCVDYAISRNFDPSTLRSDYLGNSIFSGERSLLYHAFRKVLDEQEAVPERGIQHRNPIFAGLFYTYLLIQIRFRNELVQANKRAGFNNFKNYQDRKSSFIKSKSIYYTLVSNLAINTSFLDTHLKYLEPRIIPQNTVGKIGKDLCNYDKAIYEKSFLQDDPTLSALLSGACHQTANREAYLRAIPHQFRYIFHLSKSLDAALVRLMQSSIPSNALIANLDCRHAKHRAATKNATLAIMQVRTSNHQASSRFVGLDAASGEIGCRPEVFAQAFRYARCYKRDMPLCDMLTHQQKKLGFTYHAGEDFHDLADGLRTIEEAICFLHLGRGDRLGHALAMGVNAEAYYKKKSNTLILCKHDMLDNVAWLLHNIYKCNVPQMSALMRWLQDEFNKLYHHIYEHLATVSHGGASSHTVWCDPSIYYCAMLLRGDDPALYRKIATDVSCLNPYIACDYWGEIALNSNPDATEARKNLACCILYRDYHYHEEAKKRGQEMEQWKVPDAYAVAIEHLQNALQKLVEKRHIAIETNPTSNKLIYQGIRYIDHPITRWFNMGLTFDAAEVKKCPQLSVSINTDDQGIFATSIENEFALMALALIKEDDGKMYKNRMVYDWLERVRQMAFEQAFNYNKAQ